MTWYQKIRRFGRIVILGNLLIIGALVACLEYPVFQLKEIEVTYADGREVAPEVYERVCRAVAVTPDSNLFSISRQKIAQALLQDKDIAGVEVHIGLPDRLQVRLYTAAPMIWWAERSLTPLAGDGMPVSVPALDGRMSYPLGTGNLEDNGPRARWQLVEFYHRLIEHDPRWAEVVSQISGDNDTGWELVLNGGSERILLNRHPDTETLNRLVRFLEKVPEVRWQNGIIDTRFGSNIILTPPRSLSRVDRDRTSETSMTFDISRLGGGHNPWIHKNTS